MSVNHLPSISLRATQAGGACAHTRMRGHRRRRSPSWPRATRGSWWQHIHRWWALGVLLAASDRSRSPSHAFRRPCAPCPCCAFLLRPWSIRRGQGRGGGAESVGWERLPVSMCVDRCAARAPHGGGPSASAAAAAATAAALSSPSRCRRPTGRRASGVPAGCLHPTQDGRLIVGAVTVGACRHVLWAAPLLPPTRRRRVSCSGTARAVTAAAASWARRRGFCIPRQHGVVAATATVAATGLAPCGWLPADCPPCRPAPQPLSHPLGAGGGGAARCCSP